MKESSAEPDFSVFSRFVDGELGAEEERELSAYLRSNPEARAQVARIERATKHVRMALADASLWQQLQPRIVAPECLSPDEISAYVAGVTSPREKESLERHLRTCDLCLLEAVEARKIASVLDTGRSRPVPATLKSRAEALWKPRLSLVIIQAVQRGFHLVQHYLTAPILNVEVVPLGATLRGDPKGTEQALLAFRLDAADASIRAMAVKTREGLALTLLFQGTCQEALSGKRIRIRQDGMAIVSAQTDARGKLHIPRLDPGVYEVTCQELQLAFQLEVRAEKNDA